MKNLPKRSELVPESTIEEILWREFQLAGIYPVPQYKIGKFRVDFAFPKDMLAIECDGKEWHSTEEQKQNDKDREDFLKEIGWTIMRYTGSEIWKFADQIVLWLQGQKRKTKKRLQFLPKINEDMLPEEIEEINIQRKIIEQDNEEKILENLDTSPMKNIKEVINERYLNPKNKTIL